jgi:hypothetical protein
MKMAKSALSSVQRTMRALREQGARCSVVEHFNPHVGEHGVRQDLFGILDIIALDPSGVLGIQACGSDFKKHFDKLTVEHNQETLDWLSTPGTKLYIYSWRKLKLKRGGLAMRWTAKIVEITIEDLTGKP